jgi:hypothetical protein
MPYIDKAIRAEIDPELNALLMKVAKVCDEKHIEPDGITNYVITRMLHSFFTGKYDRFERGIGCLEAAKLEFYRKKVAPYEEIKIEENGSVL